jgi:hypothetical protein
MKIEKTILTGNYTNLMLFALPCFLNELGVEHIKEKKQLIVNVPLVEFIVFYKEKVYPFYKEGEHLIETVNGEHITDYFK